MQTPSVRGEAGSEIGRIAKYAIRPAGQAAGEPLLRHSTRPDVGQPSAENALDAGAACARFLAQRSTGSEWHGVCRLLLHGWQETADGKNALGP
jgi:hypothetical protein